MSSFLIKKGVPPFILHQPQFYEIQLLSVAPPIVIGFTFHLRSLHSKHSYIFNLGFSKESTICFHHFRGRDLPNWFSQNLWFYGHIPCCCWTHVFPLSRFSQTPHQGRGAFHLSTHIAGWKTHHFCSMEWYLPKKNGIFHDYF